MNSSLHFPPFRICAAFVVLAACISSAKATQPPNIVVILADDLGFADASFTHNLYIPDAAQRPAEVQTPNIDALARQGIVFSNGYVSGNVCSPTRAGLMTGRYQQRMGIYTAGEGGNGMKPLTGPGNNGPFTPINPLIPVWLKQPGDGVPDYVCGTFGKWHLGLDSVYTNFSNQKTVETSYTMGGVNGYGLPTNGPTATSSLGTGSPWHPLNRGFDVSFHFMERGAHDYWNLNDLYYGFTRTGGLSKRIDPDPRIDQNATSTDDPVAFWDAGYVVHTDRTPANYLPNRTTDEACSFIRNQAQAGKPFFCYLPFNAAHDPAQAPSHFDAATGQLEKLGTTNGKRYATSSPDWFPDAIWFYEQYPAMQIPSYASARTPTDVDTIRRKRAITLAIVYWIDRNVGRVVQTLKDQGVYDNTIIIFLSDNGGASAMYASNLPLNGHKAQHWEGGVHVPFCFSWPNRLAALPPGLRGGRVISAPVSSLDILPTLLDAAQIPPLVAPAGLDYTLDGSSLLPLIEGTKTKLHDYMFWSEGSDGLGIARTQQWKLIIDQSKYELYDVMADVEETSNRATEHPDIVRDLRQKYFAWLVDVAADAGESPRTWTVNTTPGSPGFANLIMEPFAYPASMSLSGETGGSCWAGGWTGANAQVLPGSLTFSSPQYSNGSDQTHVARIISSDNSTGTVTRSFPALGGTVWMSFLTTYAGPNTSGASAGPNNNHETALLINGDTANQVRIYGGNSNGSAGIYDAGVKVSDVNPDTDIPTNATTVLHLLKFESNVSDESDRLTWYWTTNPAALTSRTTATLASFKSLTRQSTSDWWGDTLSSIGLLWKNNLTANSGGLNDRAFDNLRISYGLTDDEMLDAVLRGITDQPIAATGAFRLAQFGSSPNPGVGNRFVLEYDLKRNWIPGGLRYLFTETLAPGSWGGVVPALVRQLDAFGDTDTFSAEFPITTPKGFFKLSE